MAGSDVTRGLDPPSAVRERLEAFGAGVLAEAVNRPVQARKRLGLYPEFDRSWARSGLGRGQFRRNQAVRPLAGSRGCRHYT